MLRKNKLKFLSESILLEETGLPFINVVITFCVSVIIIAFIVWSNFVVMEENISISGQVVDNSIGQYEMIARVSASDVINISSGNEAYISIPGITSKEKINGIISSINTSPFYDDKGRVYYTVGIILNNNSMDIEKKLLVGMEGNVSIVVGNKTLMQYLLGNLYDSGKDAFNIK